MTTPRRITFLTTNLSRAGAETQVVRVARQLAGRGYRVRVVSMVAPSAWESELAEAGIALVSLDMKNPHVRRHHALLRLHRELRAHCPDVLIGFMIHANVLGRVAGRVAGVPRIITSIRNERFGGRRREVAERLTAPLGDAITTNSRMVADSLQARGVVRRGAVTVVPNAWEAPPPRSIEASLELRRGLLGDATDAFVWLAVARLTEQKDYPTLFQALRRLPDAVLCIAGGGELLQALQSAARSLGIGDRVRFLGVRADVPDLMRACDAFVLSSAWEGLPNVVLEAAMLGVPIVATRVGGVPEIVEHGQNGLLVPPRDPVALADAMGRMMRLSAKARGEMGRRRAAALECTFSVQAVTDRWIEVIEEVIAR